MAIFPDINMSVPGWGMQVEPTLNLIALCVVGGIVGTIIITVILSRWW